MFSVRRFIAAVAALVCTGCGSATPDYAAIRPDGTAGVESPAAAEESASTSTSPTPIADYLDGVGVTGEQVPLDKLTDLVVTLPRPKGWTAYKNPNFSPGTEAIAKNNTYPTAMVMVFKLEGSFDVAQALEHADDSAEMSENFIRLNSSKADFDGFPSSMIEGSYDLAGVRLHSYNRIVIPVTPEFDRYLVQFTVTTLANQAAAQAPEVEEIIRGFSVAVK